jgi:hypothetical protein
MTKTIKELANELHTKTNEYQMHLNIELDNYIKSQVVAAHYSALVKNYIDDVEYWKSATSTLNKIFTDKISAVKSTHTDTYQLTFPNVLSILDSDRGELVINLSFTGNINYKGRIYLKCVIYFNPNDIKVDTISEPIFKGVVSNFIELMDVVNKLIIIF